MSKQYKPTPLPSLLNLDNFNLRSQLVSSTANPKVPSRNVGDSAALSTLKTVHQNVMPLGTAPSDFDKATIECNDLVRQSITAYVCRRGPGCSFLEWLRDFHREYDDAWFSENLPRLELAFKLYWQDCTSPNSSPSGVRRSDGVKPHVTSASGSRGVNASSNLIGEDLLIGELLLDTEPKAAAANGNLGDSTFDLI